MGAARMQSTETLQTTPRINPSTPPTVPRAARAIKGSQLSPGLSTLTSWGQSRQGGSMQECLGTSVPAGRGGRVGWDHAGLSHAPGPTAET